MTNTPSLKHHFLIAVPQLSDKNFCGTLTYLFEHGAEGAMGLVVNRPAGIGLADLLQQLHVRSDYQKNTPVLAGGPVLQNQGFMLYASENNENDISSSTLIVDDLYWSTSRDILAQVTAQGQPEQLLVALGYAGWAPGQLEAEISANTWLVCPADHDILFTTSVNQRLDATVRLLGFDYNLISPEPGRA